MTDAPLDPHLDAGDRPTWASLSPDETVALPTAATHLASDFAGVFGAEIRLHRSPDSAGAAKRWHVQDRFFQLSVLRDTGRRRGGRD